VRVGDTARPLDLQQRHRSARRHEEKIAVAAAAIPRRGAVTASAVAQTERAQRMLVQWVFRHERPITTEATAVARGVLRSGGFLTRRGAHAMAARCAAFCSG